MSRRRLTTSSIGTNVIITAFLALAGGVVILNNIHMTSLLTTKVMDAPEEPDPSPVPEDPPQYFKVAQYNFPSVKERLEYYMGDWYNKFDWTPTNSTCQQLNKIRDSTTSYELVTLFTTSFLKKCKNIGFNKLFMSLYCGTAYDQISEFLDNADSNNNRWLVFFGDYQIVHRSTSMDLPFITKARPSALSGLSRSNPKPIIWLMNQGRHYGGLMSYHTDVVKKGKEIPWSEKLPKVFWRGVTTGKRMDHLAQWIKYDDNRTDIAFNNVAQTKPGFINNYMRRHYVRKQTSMSAMNRYKYLLSVEGNDVATGLKWMLYSNSVVFMSPPTAATWAMEDLLLPFVHYIPLANDYSNLLQMVQWAEEHDEACQEISKRATDYVEHLWISDQAKKDTEYLKKMLVTSYVKQFDSALSKCDLVP